MGKLKENAFWFGLGAAGVVLLIFFGVMVFPLYGQKSSYERKTKLALTSLKGVEFVPSKQDVDAWNARRAQYQKEYDQIINYYEETDKKLEGWFHGRKPAGYSQFSTLYEDEIRKLEDRIRNTKDGPGIGVEISEEEEEDSFTERFGFNWEKPTHDQWQALGRRANEVSKILQKRFWIRRRIADISIETNVQRILDVQFFVPLPKDIPLKHMKVDYPNNPFGRTRGRNPKEMALPGGHGRTISFGFTIRIRYGDLPAFIRKFLRPEQKEQKSALLVNIIGMKAFVDEQNGLVEEIEIREGEADRDAEKKKYEDSLEPVALTVQFTCQAMDFEKKVEKKEKSP